ncbi:MAG: serpin family protein [Phycisphaerales bacterium]|nr:serpin family protein [Phycisphaerales bacterium]
MNVSTFQSRSTTRRSLLAMGLGGMVLATMPQSTQAFEPDDEAKVQAICDGNQLFAFKFYNSAVTPGKNIVFSPYGMSECFGMLYAGSDAQTPELLGEIFNFPLPPSEILVSFGKLQAALDELCKDSGPLSIGNSIWTRKQSPPRPRYLAEVEGFLDADVFTVDFSETKKVKAQMDDWVVENTRGQIPFAPGEVRPNDVLVLMNTVCLDAQWKNQFKAKETHEFVFNMADGKLVETEFMFQVADFNYLQKNGVEVIELPYVGDRLSMMLIVPGEGKTLAEVEATMSPDMIDSWQKSAKKLTLGLSMPKFEFGVNLNLKPIIGRMSPTDVFAKTNLSRMLDEPQTMISEAMQDSVIRVDEQGTRAAAVTKISVTRGGTRVRDHKRVNVDRPFIFLVRDRTLGTIFFMGRVMDPRG